MKDNLTMIMNLKKSALVKRSTKNGFVVQTLDDGKFKFIADTSLKNCNTMQSFLTFFAKEYDSKRLLISTDANLKILSMLLESSATESEIAENIEVESVPYSVVNLNSLLLVSKSKNGFEVESLATGKDKFVPNSKLFGVYCKYLCDFTSTFANGLGLSSTPVEIIISEEAYKLVDLIMNFNRIDC